MIESPLRGGVLLMDEQGTKCPVSRDLKLAINKLKQRAYAVGRPRLSRDGRVIVRVAGKELSELQVMAQAHSE